MNKNDAELKNLLPDKTRTFYALPQMCLDEFKINRYDKTEPYFFGGHSSGIMWSCFYYIEEGTIEFLANDKTVVAKSGDLVYVPKGYRFLEKGLVDEKMVYYILAFSFHPQNNKFFDEKFDFTLFDEQTSAVGRDFFAKVFPLFNADEKEKLKSFSLFYDFFAEIYDNINLFVPLTFSPLLTNALTYISEHLAEDFSMEDLAKGCCASQSRIFHLFQKELKTTPVTYKNRLKIKQSFYLLTSTNLSVEDIAEKLHFHSATYFRKAFFKETGSTPTKYRKIFNRNL